MSVDVRQPFAEFLYSCFCEYRATLPPNTSIAGKLWREKVAEWHEMWHEALEEASRLYFGEGKVGE